MKKTVNDCHIEGLLYDHKLVKKQSGPNSKNPGTEFISGTVNIATDNACLNVVSVHFTYVTATTGKGGANATFLALDKILNGEPCIAKNGKENATRVRIDTSIGLNEWYQDVKDEKPVSVIRNEGGFVHLMSEPLNENENMRNTFKVDMLINGMRDVEENPERGTPAKLVISGYIFDFRQAILPIELSVTTPSGMKYFQKLDASKANPVFTQVWGNQVSQTVHIETKTESAFGEDHVSIRDSSVRDFVVTGALREPYIWDDEEYLTGAEMSQKAGERETYLAELRKRQSDFQASRQSNAANVASAAGNYNF